MRLWTRSSRTSMKQPIVFSVVAVSLAAFAFLSEPVHAANPTVIKAARHDVSSSLRTMASTKTPTATSSPKEMPEPRPTRAPFASATADRVAQQLSGSLQGVTTGVSFEGQGAQDTFNAIGTAYVPPDTNGAPGATQYVQIVNVTVAIYDKATGARLMTPVAIHTVWAGFGGPCEFAGDGGDPVVLYDHLADRWLVTQLQYDSSGSEQCVAVSTTSDATGTYNRYEYDYGVINFPDYPKYGIWPDAYYNTTNIFIPHGFAGAQACAFDRIAMLAGSAASAICFQQPPSVSSLLPSDLDGSRLPPAGSPNYFVGLADSTHLNFFSFHVDFTNPLSSTFSGPTLVSVAPYSEICARATTVSCIPQPQPGEKVDGLADRVMFRLAYRNFGDHESLVVNHTVKGGALAGVRWYEIRNPSAPYIYQQSSLIDLNVDYWLGSIAMDKIGDIALG